MSLRFTKMHGIGNDFVIVDRRRAPFALDGALVRRLGDRQRGVGFDQLLSIETSTRADCAYAYRIFNADGSSAEQCGNGVRCVASWLLRNAALDPGATRLDSPAGPIAVEVLADGRVRVDMGSPNFAPAALPFLAERAARSYALAVAGQQLEIGAVSMGNPHAVLPVASCADAAVASLGPAVERHALFPQGCNVGFVEIVSRGELRLRVWERAVGETLACGSGACAAVAVLRERDLVDSRVTVHLPGGELEIDWPGGNAALWMTGPTEFVFEGEWLQ